MYFVFVLVFVFGVCFWRLFVFSVDVNTAVDSYTTPVLVVLADLFSAQSVCLC